MASYQVLDLEIRDPFPPDLPREEAWNLARGGGLGVSVVGLYDSELDQYLLFDQHNMDELPDLIRTVTTLVTFNGKGFDLPCLAGALETSLMPKTHYDILEVIWTALGDVRRYEKGWGLGPVCERTIGRGKSGKGSTAPELWSRGRLAELYSYCLNDVVLTNLLYCYIMEHGSVLGPDGEPLELDAHTCRSDY